MNKKTAIYEYLRQNHVGAEKAVCSRELERLFALDGRELRRKISSLRQDGVPICSGPTGYYYAANHKEICDNVLRLDRLMGDISNTRTSLLYASGQHHGGLTLEVKIDLTEGR